jgi:hypothetical protein
MMPYQVDALARRTGLSIGLDVTQHTRPVVFPGNEFEGATHTKMASDQIVMMLS